MVLALFVLELHSVFDTGSVLLCAEVDFEKARQALTFITILFRILFFCKD